MAFGRKSREICRQRRELDEKNKKISSLESNRAGYSWARYKINLLKQKNRKLQNKVNLLEQENRILQNKIRILSNPFYNYMIGHSILWQFFKNRPLDQP